MPAFGPFPDSRVLAQSAVAVSHTGNTNETTLATITIPGGAMGANGQLEIVTTWTYTNSANAKVLRVRFGGASGTTYLSTSVTTTATLHDLRRICNRGSASSQVGGFGSGTPSYSTSTSAVTTSTVDTSADTTLVITGALASAAETVTLENYCVVIRPKA